MGVYNKVDNDEQLVNDVLANIVKNIVGLVPQIIGKES